MVKFSNPFAFVPMSVTIFVTVVYLAILIPILVVQETVPPAPANPVEYRGLNLTEAWLDLAELTKEYHPFNSRRSDEIRDWLLRRIETILEENGAHGGKLVTPGQNDTIVENQVSVSPQIPDVNAHREGLRTRSSSAATIFNDLVSNYTSTALTSIGVTGRRLGISTYFEGNNIIVYIRGTEDEESDWWIPSRFSRKTHGKGGVLVNAHFDSVATGFGATDDGMGVITTLQLIKYFTTPGNTPKKGIVALLNNGEEDGLYGAKAFLSHPMASFVHTFLNLEGAGAGGRATLFRTTDTEVTRSYGKAKNPFGTVISDDGFSLGFVRSETDYIVFRAEGYRGLDLAFYEPRARYHTDQDDARHASKASLWHMLSASLATVKDLTSDLSNKFNGPRGDNDTNKVKNGHGTQAIWFDIFGQTFVVFQLHTLFAWSLTILIVSPLILALITFFLVRQNKYYFFAGAVKVEGHDSESVNLDGWRGAFRFPIVVIVSSALTVGAAFLLRKVNPLIVYSSPYSVWAMSTTLFFSSFWFLMAGCNFVRPSALHRGYAFIWLFIFGWATLIAATVSEDRFKLAGGYLVVFYEGAIFLATVIALCELFALPTKNSVIEASHDEHETRDGLESLPQSDGNFEPAGNSADDGDATETTPLVGGNGHGRGFGTTFANRYRQIVAAPETGDGVEESLEGPLSFGDEQKWSATLPTWTWVLQFLLVGPFLLIILGQVGLFLVAATGQTGSDGSSPLVPYLIVAGFTILLFLPVGPFIHRITHHLPAFFFLVFIGTLIYNLVAFPFSSNNRYKVYFQQTVDLDSGTNEITIGGIQEYVLKIIAHVPSASGQSITCKDRPNLRAGLDFCTYQGIAPSVIRNVESGIPPEKGYKDWLHFNVTRTPNRNKARFEIQGQETRACIIRWDDPFTAFKVHGAANEAAVPDSGSDQIKLWHRDWNKEWVVDAEWPVSEGKQPGDEGRSGRVVCLWSDHNLPGVIPALDEVQAFAPEWAVVTKLMDGLVEGSKAFIV